jgi:hypothetical protein
MKRRLTMKGLTMKSLVTVLIALGLAAWATPATAYVVQITTSIPVESAGDDTQLEDALKSAVHDVLQHAIAFAPTLVAVRDARVVGDRVYILLLVADGEGEETIKELVNADQTDL